MAYLRLHHLHNAFEDLVSTDKAIAHIAFYCGMDDLAYFSRVFKKHYGRTPYKVRKTYRHHSPPDNA